MTSALTVRNSGITRILNGTFAGMSLIGDLCKRPPPLLLTLRLAMFRFIGVNSIQRQHVGLFTPPPHFWCFWGYFFGMPI